MAVESLLTWRLGISALALLGGFCLIGLMLNQGSVENLSATQALYDNVNRLTSDKSLATHRPAFRINKKVAMITDTELTARHLPLIIHFSAVLGPDWPIVFFTSQAVIDEHLSPPEGSKNAGSAILRRAVAEGQIDVRLIPDDYNLTSRVGVNNYLSRSWLWQQLAPAEHVLIFQADAMICANSHRTIDDYLQYDFIGAPLGPQVYNGGLSLRNRTMILDIIEEGNSWEADTAAGKWPGFNGEDIYFSQKMADRGGNLPSEVDALSFAVEWSWQADRSKEPFGYHKVHKYAGDKLRAIAEWCPEIALAAAGILEGVPSPT